MAKNIPELRIEPIGEQANLHYMCLLEYKREQYLCVVDNITPTEISAFVLDYAEQENIPLSSFLSLATYWFYSKSDKHPLSVEIARLGLTRKLGMMHRTFDTAYVSRIVGNVFSFAELNTVKVKRRRVVSIPEGIEIRLKKPI